MYYFYLSMNKRENCDCYLLDRFHYRNQTHQCHCQCCNHHHVRTKVLQNWQTSFLTKSQYFILNLKEFSFFNWYKKLNIQTITNLVFLFMYFFSTKWNFISMTSYLKYFYFFHNNEIIVQSRKLRFKFVDPFMLPKTNTPVSLPM